MSDEEIREIIKNICKVIYDEVETEYWIEVLTIGTDLSNLSDYMFYPDSVGLKFNATYDEIIDKILLDRDSGKGIILL